MDVDIANYIHCVSITCSNLNTLPKALLKSEEKGKKGDRLIY